MVDATPHTSFVSLIAKALSLVAVTVVLNLFFILCSNMTIPIKNKKVNVQLTLTPEYLDFKTIYFKDSDNKKNRIIKINKNETIKKIINLQKRFGNQKSTLDYVGFKATYSKKLFDKFLSDKSFELKEYLVYL